MQGSPCAALGVVLLAPRSPSPPPWPEGGPVGGARLPGSRLVVSALPRLALPLVQDGPSPGGSCVYPAYLLRALPLYPPVKGFASGPGRVIAPPGDSRPATASGLQPFTAWTSDSFFRPALDTAGAWETSTKEVHTMKQKITNETRKAVYRRDNYECAVCGDNRRLQIHHILERSQGGDNDQMNLITLCPICHALAHGVNLAGIDLTPSDVDDAIVEYMADYYAGLGVRWPDGGDLTRAGFDRAFDEWFYSFTHPDPPGPEG